jgi:hypothetical protein
MSKNAGPVKYEAASLGRELRRPRAVTAMHYPCNRG